MNLEPTTPSRHFFEYDDYRALLAKLMAERKARGLPCSYRWMAQQAGYTSPNFFKLVIDQERELTAEGAEKVVQMFKLSVAEGDYFRALVQFQRAKDLTDKLHYAEMLVGLKPRLATSILAKDQFEYHRKWAYVVLREVLTLREGFRNADEICEKVSLGLSRVQIHEGIVHLQKLGLIASDGQGFLRVRHQTLRSGDRVINSALFGFHLEILDLAKQALGRFKAHEREFHAVTVRLTPEAYELARRKIQKLKDEILELSEAADTAENVLQLNLQLFPVAQLKKGNS